MKFHVSPCSKIVVNITNADTTIELSDNMIPFQRLNERDFLFSKSSRKINTQINEPACTTAKSNEGQFISRLWLKYQTNIQVIKDYGMLLSISEKIEENRGDETIIKTKKKMKAQKSSDEFKTTTNEL